MKKKFSYKYSFISLAIRIFITLILFTAIALIYVYREDISAKVYHWDKLSSVPADFSVHYIDVGQGDSTLIEFDDGKNMLIDCGPASSSEKVTSYISGLGIDTIEYFLITHPDEDHIGSGDKVFEQFEVKNFYRPMFRSRSEDTPSAYPLQDTKIYDTVITYAKREHDEQNCNIFYSSDAISIQGENYTVSFLYPSQQPVSDTNQSSAIVLADLDGVKFLFTGDAEKKQEESVVTQYGSMINVDVLKIGHHGSNSSTSEVFLNATSPQYGVISCGKDNKYGHPTQATLENLNKFGVKVLRTDQVGDIILAVKGGVLDVNGKGQMIDYVLICSLILVVIFVVWAVPEPKKNPPNKKDVKK